MCFQQKLVLNISDVQSSEIFPFVPRYLKGGFGLEIYTSHPLNLDIIFSCLLRIFHSIMTSKLHLTWFILNKEAWEVGEARKKKKKRFFSLVFLEFCHVFDATTLIAPLVILYWALYSEAHLEYLLQKNAGQVGMKPKVKLLLHVTTHQWGQVLSFFVYIFDNLVQMTLAVCQFCFILFYFSRRKGVLEKKLKPYTCSLLISLFFFFNYWILCHVKIN